ncbi:MAG: molybdopterin-guanine dinucleotide biosynthesis protein B [Gemmatimonadota bacterium]
MPPLLTVVGRKNSGKTTTVVRLASALHRRGHRVMTLKHGSHTFSIDPATTDTWRHFHEGEAERVAMASPDRFALVMRWSEELGPEEIAARYLPEADIVICEGFTRSQLPRIEVFRREVHQTPHFDANHESARLYRGIITDDPAFTAPLPVISFSDERWLDELADLVEKEIASQRAS